jgi:hypothetical protein
MGASHIRPLAQAPLQARQRVRQAELTAVPVLLAGTGVSDIEAAQGPLCPSLTLAQSCGGSARQVGGREQDERARRSVSSSQFCKWSSAPPPQRRKCSSLARASRSERSCVTGWSPHHVQRGDIVHPGVDLRRQLPARVVEGRVRVQAARCAGCQAPGNGVAAAQAEVASVKHRRGIQAIRDARGEVLPREGRGQARLRDGRA